MAQQRFAKKQSGATGRIQAAIVLVLLLELPGSPLFAQHNSTAIYTARSTPARSGPPAYHAYPHRSRIIKKSPGYDVAPGQSGLALQLYYQAPSTTSVTHNVQVIPPQNGVGDVYYSQDTYYLYPQAPAYHNHYHAPERPLIPVIIDPNATQNRAKQWTDKTDLDR